MRSSGCGSRATRWRPAVARCSIASALHRDGAASTSAAGPRGITDLLSERVGPDGRVVGLDMDEQHLAHARKTAPANVEFLRGDAYNSNLPAGTFDLVHMRFVASTAGDPERLLQEAMRLTRAGGVVALQEPDASTLELPSAASGMGQTESGADRRVRGRRRRSGAGAAALRARARGRARGCPLSAVSHRRSFDRRDRRLSALDRGVAARHRAQARPPVRSGIARRAGRVPRACAPSGHGLHDVHGGPGLGAQAGVEEPPRGGVRPPSYPHLEQVLGRSFWALGRVSRAESVVPLQHLILSVKIAQKCSNCCSFRLAGNS